MEKRHLDRRLQQMADEGTRFKPSVHVGAELTASSLRARYDAVVLAVGATAGRDLPAPGRELAGILQAMEYLPHANRHASDPSYAVPVSAEGKHVVIIGGGDTGADCLGTAHRQGAASVTQLEILPRPADERPEGNPWPTWPLIYRTSSAHEEGGERVYAVSTTRFLEDGDGNVASIELVDVEMVEGRFQPIEGTERKIPADLVLLAMGFTGPERPGLLEQLGVELDGRGNIARDGSFMSTVPGVFVAGDAGRGQSLIVWAIAEGRAAAAAVDEWLSGGSELPAPVTAAMRPLTV
jgi:glutamate synthase (NADPH/NADH) small chain